MNQISRQQALYLLQKYNKEPFHIQHALTVEGVMRYYATALGYEADVDFWGLCGLLHDEDFEQYIKDWQRKEEVTGNLAKMLYRDEAEDARQEVVNGFKDLGDDLRAQGIENAEKWGEGFAQKVFELISQIQTKISEAFNNFIATPTYAVAGSGGVSTIDLSGLSQNNSAKQNRNIILKLKNREVGRTIGESVSTERNRIGGSFTGGR